MSEIKKIISEYNEIIDRLANKLETHSDAYFEDLTENEWCDLDGEVSFLRDDGVYSFENYGSAGEVENYIYFMSDHGNVIHILDKNNKCDPEDERFI